MSQFCNPFDEVLAEHGPAAVFLRDDEGTWRFSENWTRDTWQRSPGPHAIDHRFALLRDHLTGFVQLLLVTSPTLIPEHPRADVRLYDTLDAAESARAAFGSPPVAAAW